MGMVDGVTQCVFDLAVVARLAQIYFVVVVVLRRHYFHCLWRLELLSLPSGQYSVGVRNVGVALCFSTRHQRPFLSSDNYQIYCLSKDQTANAHDAFYHDNMALGRWS